MRLSLVQMTASNDLEANLQTMEKYVSQAKQAGSQLVAFPELAYFIGTGKENAPVVAQYMDLLKRVSGWASHYGIDIVPGTFREPASSGGNRQLNTLLYFDAGGYELGRYQKIFLFRANLPDRAYDEAKHYDGGKHIVTVNRHNTTLGFAICFDLRFPELFRSLKKRGAQLIILPAAYTVPTGKAHWHTLLRARAIENQVFVAAPGLTGKCGDGRETYGHTILYSPWGDTVGELAEAPGILTCDIRVEDIAQDKQRLDAWACRREDLFPMP